MKALLRIFRYARKRIIKLSIENHILKQRIALYQAILDEPYEKKH
nr:hypothetical protein [uncultured Mediterranean phage uvMED]